MQIVVDDATRPMSTALNVALGYLFGLGLLGYMAVLTWIRERGARQQWPQRRTQILTGLHLLMGLTVMCLVPASLLRRLTLQGGTSTTGAIAFAITLFAMVGLVGWLAQDWNRWHRK